MLKAMTTALLRSARTHPTGFAASFLFIAGFAVVSANALIAQPGDHPEPIWITRDATPTHSVPAHQVEKTARLTPNKVRTQKLSIEKLPVPSQKPVEQPRMKPSRAMVTDLQKELARLGYYKGKIDGLYGAGTRSAILQLQEKLGLSRDGFVTYDILKAAQDVPGGTPVETRSAEIGFQSPGSQELIKVSTGSTEKPAADPKKGYDRETVRLIQLGLSTWGEADIKVDGVFGSQTATAIRQFQKQFNLAIDGKPSQKLLREMQKLGALRNG